MSQQSKSTLQSAINTQLADNTSGDISAADVRDNLINMTDSLLFNNETTQTLTGALTVTAGITGSLQGTATTASFVTTAQTASYVLNAVSASYATQALSASWAPNTGGSSFPYTGSALITGSLGITGSLTQHAGNIAMGVADTFGNRNINLLLNGSDEYVTLGAGNNSSKPNRLQLYSSTGVSQLIAANEILLYAPTIVLSGSVLFEKAITSSLQGTASYATVAETLLGSVTSASYAATASYVENAQTASYFDGTAPAAATASLSLETIGAGLYGGEIQFRAGTAQGKNIFTDAFTWNIPYSGLQIGDYNTIGGYGTGDYFIALGYDAVAAGFAAAFGSSSYAQGEGSFTHGKAVTSTGNYSHAEGISTQAVGQYSHAEGISSIAGGDNSHAEGNSTEATGQNSHAEGQFTLAIGGASHAEGVSTVSLGVFSHAEGVGTIASGSAQHVQGRYNTHGDTTSLMIVGNGTDDNTRKDAFKVRMSGSIVLPTTASGTPGWTGTNGEIIPGDDGAGNYVLWVYLGGNWLTSSLGI